MSQELAVFAEIGHIGQTFPQEISRLTQEGGQNP
jgi:hypothetical protein